MALLHEPGNDGLLCSSAESDSRWLLPCPWACSLLVPVASGSPSTVSVHVFDHNRDHLQPLVANFWFSLFVYRILKFISGRRNQHVWRGTRI
ncbi:hypothetical protein BRADI_1g18565v3 [Brachypodium distachyon]|uniref:Uncharacterized protein n=1 Tax=Brachypodium distachyon TaxID=15368 RepID=A0A0Q3RP73_BRADI|nr:hypothetical protein BRADI_1g18565v3 [Brachypodium distachyon]